MGWSKPGRGRSWGRGRRRRRPCKGKRTCRRRSVVCVPVQDLLLGKKLASVSPPWSRHWQTCVTPRASRESTRIPQCFTIARTCYIGYDTFRTMLSDRGRKERMLWRMHECACPSWCLRVCAHALKERSPQLHSPITVKSENSLWIWVILQDIYGSWSWVCLISYILYRRTRVLEWIECIN